MEFTSRETICCTTCNRNLQDLIFSTAFFPTLAALIFAFIILVLAAEAFIKIYERKFTIIPGVSKEIESPIPLFKASLIIGIGAGGFIDGIVFHQVLQWHQMLSYKFPPVSLNAKSLNMFWDGIFHVFTLTVLIAGIYLLWKISQKKIVNTSGSIFYNGMIIGWGLFNVIEGIFNHHILKLHNVREITPHPEYWNLGFLFFSLLLIVIGNHNIQKSLSIQRNS